jgi:hypothetical protein
MDAAIRLNFLAGDLRVPASEILPFEWMKIIERLSRSQHVPYFGCFTQLSEILSLPVYGNKRLVPDTAFFDTVVSDDDMVILVGGPYIMKGTSPENPPFEEEMLLLCKDRSWTWIRVNIERDVSDRGIVETMAKVTATCNASLRHTFLGHPDFQKRGLEILHSLLRVIQQGRKNAEQRASNLAHLEQIAQGVLSRIGE